MVSLTALTCQMALDAASSAASSAAFPPVIGMAHLDGSNGFTINGVADGDLSGFSVSAAGDINGG